MPHGRHRAPQGRTADPATEGDLNAHHPTPLYVLTCDRSDCGYLADIDGDGRCYFQSPEEARAWALGWGWARDAADGRLLICPPCAVEQQNAADEAAEIAAAVQHALDLP